jgi:DNA-binding response OmpR family regulator
MRILLVDDYPRLAQSIIEGLAGFGLHVDLFATGGEGLAAAKSMSYDAMILDLGLPDRDGFDVISELRAAGKRIPILILTASLDFSNFLGASGRRIREDVVVQRFFSD